MSTTTASWGKCDDCDAEAVFRFREMETKRQAKAGKPGKLIGQYCTPHAYAAEVETSPWRIMLPLHMKHYQANMPPIRLLDGRLYQVDSILDRHPPKSPTVNRPYYDLDAGSLLYRPKLKAWVRKSGRTLVTVTKDALESGPMAKHVYDALNRLPVTKGGKVRFVLREDAGTVHHSTPNYHVGLLWIPDPA